MRLVMPLILNGLLEATEMAADLLSLPGEDQNLTSSFRPPGGPTPTRGFFLPGDLPVPSES